MGRLLHRYAVLVICALAVAVTGLVAAFDTAHAGERSVAVSWSEWDQGTNFLLNAQATHDVNHDAGVAHTVCGMGIRAALAVPPRGLPMPDESRKICEHAVLKCVHDAVRVKGNALSGVRFYTGRNPLHPLGGYRCLVR